MRYRSKPESPIERCRWKDNHSRDREDREMEGAFPTGSQSCRSTQTCRHPGGLDQITEAEVREAIKAQKNGKAPGSDSVCAEMLKADEQETHSILCQIFQRIWDEEDTPDDWKTGTIIKLPKKGDLGNCNNWRGITLLSITCKIFSRIILKRISAATDTILRQEQAGFRRGKSCIDHIFTLRQILEQSTE